MSKRNPGHPRKPRDLYQTPSAPVAPLLPFLRKGTRFVEPCCASGMLIDALEAAGHFCVAASDIHPLKPDYGTLDARQQPKPPEGVIFITNPPWTRELLGEIIVHLSNLAPFWALFDADWQHTSRVATPHLPRLRKIVSVGRVKWVFEGSKTAGFDNAAWHLFDRPSAAPTEFYGRGAVPTATTRSARICYDCRLVIGPRDKWRLAERNGVPTCAHRDCANPRGEPGPPAPMPLFEVPPEDGPCGACAEADAVLESGAYFCQEMMTFRRPGPRICSGAPA